MPPSAERELEPVAARGPLFSKPLGTHGEQYTDTDIRQVISDTLVNTLYGESTVIKIWNVARKALGGATPPVLYPEYTGTDKRYVYRNLDFWTSGFFPGSLYLVHERQIKHPRFYGQTGNATSTLPHRLHLHHLCQWWSASLHQNAGRQDTHDLGFMIAPWAIKAWELYRDPQAYNSLVLAAHSLARRFDARVQSIRSWDECYTIRYSFAPSDRETDFLVIIDNMLNLDLLFWVAHETGDRSLYDIAIAHARTSQKHHVRADKSTLHVVNYDPATGEPKKTFTHQGHSDESCWSRGQAWGILGFMQTYEWTREAEFLATAKDLADYFMKHLPEDYVPYWDFDAPVNESCPRDTSAGMVACCGLVLLYKALRYTDRTAAQHYLDSALRILEGTVSRFMTPSTATFSVDSTETAFAVYPETERQTQPGRLTVSLNSTSNGEVKQHDSLEIPETILEAATVCNYEFATRRWADHGLVYADYYFLLLGNMLLEMGIVRA
ncbi:glycoside hydrolase family 88 protein [Aspergillus stella-maris]|uniref:glycoside hydrolase family 88 protein n=1 Tax=Aspergillus stella-maris TaxID=1810926 RepID=UPI003CCE5241